MPPYSENFWKKTYPHLFKTYPPHTGNLGASQLGYHISQRSNRTGKPILNKPQMPKRANSRKRAAGRSPARAFRRRRTTSSRRTSSRSGRLGDVHSFKGIINAGILSALPAGTSTHLGGQYIFQLTDLPIYQNMNNCFDFVRVNSCRMEFLPRANMAQINTETNVTFLTGLDEIPMVGTSSTVAPTWSAQGSEDAGVTESKAYDHVRITPDYVRGMQNSRETEAYKKHTRVFTPWHFINTVDTITTGMSSGVQYQKQSRKWIALNYLDQTTGTEIASGGPDYYGPMYSFGANNGISSPTPLYDVKLHYSISFRRLKGF